MAVLTVWQHLRSRLLNILILRWSLTLLLPYHPAERPIPTPEGFDGTFYPPGIERVPRKFAIIRANRYVVDHVDYLIAYAWHPASNARELVEYARKHKRMGGIVITEIDKLRLNEYTGE